MILCSGIFFRRYALGVQWIPLGGASNTVMLPDHDLCLLVQLWNFVSHGRVIQVKRCLKFLKERGVGPRQVVASGYSLLLHRAVGRTIFLALRLVKLLLEYGIPVNARDQDGNTLVHAVILRPHLAQRAGAVPLLELLLRHGASADAENLDGNTPLHLAAWAGYFTMVCGLLEYGVALSSGNKHGDTPLHLAAQAGRTRVVKLLLLKGGVVLSTATNKDGDTPQHLAAREGCLLVVESLLRYGADVSIKNNSGDTVLHEAINAGNRAVVSFLISQHACLSVDDGNGLSPWELAVARGFFGVSALIEVAAKRTKPEEQLVFGPEVPRLP